MSVDPDPNAADLARPRRNFFSFFFGLADIGPQWSAARHVRRRVSLGREPCRGLWYAARGICVGWCHTSGKHSASWEMTHDGWTVGLLCRARSRASGPTCVSASGSPSRSQRGPLGAVRLGHWGSNCRYQRCPVRHAASSSRVLIW